MNANDLPYPIRQRDNGWEVVLTDQGEVWNYVQCNSQDDAEAVADARPLNGIAMKRGIADKTRVRRCVDALRRYGIDERQLLMRRVASLT